MAVLALMALAIPASAADLPTRMPVKAPIVPVWSWTGFYVGANLGYSWGRSSTDATFNNATTGALDGTASDKFNLNGVIGGGQLGYNWQTGMWVLGVETDFQGSAEKGSTTFFCGTGQSCSTINTAIPAGAAPANASFNQKIDWFGTLRGRVGYTVVPTVLLYATGGLAYASIKTDGVLTAYNSGGIAVGTAFSNSSTRVGWTVGGGIEGQISGNWTAKAEYLYIDYGSLSGSAASVGTLPLFNFGYNSHVTDQVVRAGINYRF
jgi:outer membrane immunogenic protein